MISTTLRVCAMAADDISNRSQNTRTMRPMVRGVHAFFTTGVPPGSRLHSNLSSVPDYPELGGMMKTFAIALATLLTGCLAATAQATVPVKGVQQQVVRYGDLNVGCPHRMWSAPGNADADRDPGPSASLCRRCDRTCPRRRRRVCVAAAPARS